MIAIFVEAQQHQILQLQASVNPKELYPLRQRIGKRAGCTHTLVCVPLRHRSQSQAALVVTVARFACD
jgi:hypothetical protein